MDPKRHPGGYTIVGGAASEEEAKLPEFTTARKLFLKQKVQEAHKEVLSCYMRLQAFKEEMAKSDYSLPESGQA